ncbi:MAG TPA: hypothetical protein VK645_13225 [Chitinophagaceae bacterium]|nr:hypothetical protein [Chitinophagaceae bacterium]
MSRLNPFKTLQKIHSTMLAGMVVFCVVSAIVRLPNKMAAYPNLNRVLQVTVLAVTFILIKTGLSVFNRKLQRIPPMATPVEKLDIYRIAAIIKWVMIEVPVLLAVVSFMMTRNYAFIALAFALIIFFAFQGPVRLKIMQQLQLSETEFRQLEGVSD